MSLSPEQLTAAMAGAWTLHARVVARPPEGGSAVVAHVRVDAVVAGGLTICPRGDRLHLGAWLHGRFVDAPRALVVPGRRTHVAVVSEPADEGRRRFSFVVDGAVLEAHDINEREPLEGDGELALGAGAPPMAMGPSVGTWPESFAGEVSAVTLEPRALSVAELLALAAEG